MRVIATFESDVFSICHKAAQAAAQTHKEGHASYRPYIDGVCMILFGKQLKFVGADGYIAVDLTVSGVRSSSDTRRIFRILGKAIKQPVQSVVQLIEDDDFELGIYDDKTLLARVLEEPADEPATICPDFEGLYAGLHLPNLWEEPEEPRQGKQFGFDAKLMLKAVNAISKIDGIEWRGFIQSDTDPFIIQGEGQLGQASLTTVVQVLIMPRRN